MRARRKGGRGERKGQPNEWAIYGFRAAAASTSEVVLRSSELRKTTSEFFLLSSVGDDRFARFEYFFSENPERHNGVAFPLLPRAHAHVSTVEKCVFAFTAFTLLENQGVMVERFGL